MLKKQLQTSELQFAFKSDHSTVMCTSVLKEIISHYSSRDSNNYICLIDASKRLTELIMLSSFHYYNHVILLHVLKINYGLLFTSKTLCQMEKCNF